MTKNADALVVLQNSVLYSEQPVFTSAREGSSMRCSQQPTWKYHECLGWQECDSCATRGPRCDGLGAKTSFACLIVICCDLRLRRKQLFELEPIW